MVLGRSLRKSFRFLTDFLVMRDELLENAIFDTRFMTNQFKSIAQGWGNLHVRTCRLENVNLFEKLLHIQQHAAFAAYKTGQKYSMHDQCGHSSEQLQLFFLLRGRPYNQRDLYIIYAEMSL